MDDTPAGSDTSRPDQRFLHFRRNGSLVSQPGLDGLRGLAVAAVVLFHADVAAFSGGYLGVSLFFTLSGFLITALALAEIDDSGSFRRGAFWSRRFRRLLPAAWFTIGAVLVVAVLLATFDRSLRLDIWASLAYVANWRFLSAGQSYAALFTGESPLLHFWSLAIEEQFYLVFPLLVAGVVSVSRRPARLLGVVFAAVALVSFALPLTIVDGLDRVYYGTDTRAGEIALGAVCAAVLSVRPVRAALLGGTVRRVVGALGLVVAIIVAGAWVGLTRTWSGIENGGLALVAVSSVILVVASLVPGGPLHRVVMWWPLRTLGRISFAVYLFHWPALTYLTEERTGLRDPFRVVLILAGVVGLALVSERLLERPFRRGRLNPSFVRASGVVALLALALVPAVAPTTEPAETLARLEDEAAAYRDALQSAETGSSAPATAPTSADSPPRPAVGMFGDSILLTVALASGYYNSEWQHMAPGDGVLELGCGVVRGGRRRTDVDVRAQESCDDWPETWAASATEHRPDVAVVMSCQWENVDRRYEGGEWIHVGTEAFDDLIRAEYGAATDLLAEAGVSLVVWVRCPYFSQVVGTDGLSDGFVDSRDPARMDRLNALIDEVVAERPEHAAVVDLAAWVNPRVDDESLRPDGSHYEREVDTGAGRVFTELVVAAYRDWWFDHSADS